MDKAPARVIKSPSNETSTRVYTFLTVDTVRFLVSVRDDEEVAHTLLTPKATLLQESVLSIKTSKRFKEELEAFLLKMLLLFVSYDNDSF